MRRARGSGLFRDQRGTASIEAAVMLPLMAICWIGLFFRFDSLDTTLDAANEARRAAWITSNAGCDGETVQYDCNDETGAEGNGAGGWLDSIQKVPVVGWLFGSVFGYSTTAHVSHDVQIPSMFGGGTTPAGYSYYIMCNEKPMTVGDMLKATICEQLDDVPVIRKAVSCPSTRHDDVPKACQKSESP